MKNIALLTLIIIAIGCKEDEDLTATLLNPKLDYGQIADIDGNNYATIQIGNQKWMAENLKTTRFSNGDTIPIIEHYLDWIYDTLGAWCYYNNDKSFNTLYGKWYNWYAVNDSRNICPKGWRVPSDKDWSELVNFLGGEDLAGKKMKTQLEGHWNGSNSTATNESGFSALPGGQRNDDGSSILMTYRAPFWSTTAYEKNGSFPNPSAYIREIFWNGDAIGRYNEYMSDGYCIRCIKE